MTGYIVHRAGPRSVSGPYPSFEDAVEAADRFGPDFVISYGNRWPGADAFEEIDEPLGALTQTACRPL